MRASTIRHTRKREPIDVLIPAVEKDLSTLPYVINSVRKYVTHPIGQIYVVSPPSSRIKALCQQKRCKYINEHTVLPIRKKDIHYRTSRWDRSGWLLQQLLKLSGDKICSRKHFLVIDADTVLIRPHLFRSKQKTIYYCRKWSRGEYFRAYRRLLGNKATSPVSFVTHYMLFDKAKLIRLKRRIEERHRCSWYTAILKSVNRSSQFGFSEFETYGNYVNTAYPGSMIIRPSLNKSLFTNASALTPAQIQKLSTRFRSLSFHKRRGYYLRKRRA